MRILQDKFGLFSTDVVKLEFVEGQVADVICDVARRVACGRKFSLPQEMGGLLVELLPFFYHDIGMVVSADIFGTPMRPTVKEGMFEMLDVEVSALEVAQAEFVDVVCDTVRYIIGRDNITMPDEISKVLSELFSVIFCDLGEMVASGVFGAPTSPPLDTP